MTQQGRNMHECVTIDDKTLFVHLLVIRVFVFGLYIICIPDLPSLLLKAVSRSSF
jgi:hypothetical protein